MARQHQHEPPAWLPCLTARFPESGEKPGQMGGPRSDRAVPTHKCRLIGHPLTRICREELSSLILFDLLFLGIINYYF